LDAAAAGAIQGLVGGVCVLVVVVVAMAGELEDRETDARGD
jgi:hypothetical protein